MGRLVEAQLCYTSILVVSSKFYNIVGPKLVIEKILGILILTRYPPR